LASFSGLQAADFDTLVHYTLLAANKLLPVLEHMLVRGLLREAGGSYSLTEARCL
jgi:hypothetical protein